jgi:Domain of unknown function (DUF4347)
MKPTISGKNVAGWDEANYRVAVPLAGDPQFVWLNGGGPGGAKLEVALDPPFPALVKITENPPLPTGWREFVLIGQMVGKAQVAAYSVQTVGNNRQTRTPWSVPLQIEVTNTLLASGGPAIHLFLKSSTLGLASVGVSIFADGDFNETVNNIGEIPVVAQRICSKLNKYIWHLSIAGHGSTDDMTIGSDTINIQAMSRYAPSFNLLHNLFRGDSFVNMMGCSVGENADFMRRIAAAMGVPVYASIGGTHTYGTSATGQYGRCTPEGAYTVTTSVP